MLTVVIYNFIIKTKKEKKWARPDEDIKIANEQKRSILLIKAQQENELASRMSSTDWSGAKGITTNGVLV